MPSSRPTSPARAWPSVDAEARAIERGLRIELVIGQGDDHLHVALRLHEAAHHAEAGRAARHRLRAWQRRG